MNNFIYEKLAVTNLKNNRKTYVPYIFTGVLTVMMFYIIDALSKGEGITQNTLKICLQYATGVIIVFAVIFLFYTNSFLIKRRKKEIGVYNILGMGNRHIARMMAVETILTAGISILGGLVFGIIFGKLMYLLLLKILHNSVDMQFSVNGTAIVQTVILFAGIFLLTYLYNILQIQLVNPVELLHGGNQGEKEPKSRWLLVIVGVAALGNGYWIALTTEAPLEALLKFFVAVVCVIIGTYALFIAGSIVVLKILRKNKAYYYNPKHFTSVSGMIYRMKQNGAGLANICVLSRSSFYELYGGLFFIGIYLGSMFIMATVLIIYYKQISEGYDDRERYQIMQKVGMSKKEVKRSIRSQVLSVFFLPLVVAAIHVAVAFKVMTKILGVLNLTNVSLFAVCTIITIAVFAVFYIIVYSITAKEYYRIVN